MIIRSLRADELDNAVRLADQIFRESEPVSMRTEYPMLFSESMIEQSYGAFENGKLASLLGLVPSVVCVGEARLNVYSLGSVCTHPDYRGRGHASEVLKRVMTDINEAGASLLLVSGDRPLYERAGCHSFGEVSLFQLDSKFAQYVFNHGFSSELQVREMERKDWLKLEESTVSRKVRFEQSIWDLAKLIKADGLARYQHKIMIAEKGQKISGFLVLGVFTNPELKQRPTVFEWSGDGDTVTQLLASAVQRFDLEQLDFRVPWYEETVARKLAFLTSKQEQNQGTVKMINCERFIEQIRPYLHSIDADLDKLLTVRSLENGHTELVFDGKGSVLSPAEFISFVFDLNPCMADDKQLDERLKTLFPIPFPYTGGLNYV